MKEEIAPGSHAAYVGESGDKRDLNYGQTGTVYPAMNVRRRTDRQRFLFKPDGDTRVVTVVRTDFNLFGEERPASINPRFEREREARYAHLLP